MEVVVTEGRSQEVERQVGHRRGRRGPLDPGGQPRERGRAGVVEGHDLAVEHRSVGQAGLLDACRGDLREPVGDVAPGAAAEAEPLGEGGREHPHAVPFDLESPGQSRARPGREGPGTSQHGTHPSIMDVPAPTALLASGDFPTGMEGVMRAMWKGAVAFGLVNVPVKVYSATEDHDVRFHQVHAADGGRIRMQRTCSVDGEEGRRQDLAKAYESPDGRVVVMDETDFADLPVPGGARSTSSSSCRPSRSTRCCSTAATTSSPTRARSKPYVLLREALEPTDRTAIGAGRCGRRPSSRRCGCAATSSCCRRCCGPTRCGGRVRRPRRRRRAAPAGAGDGRLAGREPLGGLRPDEYRDEYREALLAVMSAARATAPE